MRKLTLILLFAFASCYTSKVATKQVYKAYAKQPEVTATFCSTIYPVQSSTQYIRGKDSVITLYDTFDCDSVIKHDTTHESHLVTIPFYCPVLRVDTFRETVESTAKLAGKDLQLNKANETITRQDKRLKTARTINGIIGLLLVLSIIGNIMLLKIRF